MTRMGRKSCKRGGARRGTVRPELQTVGSNCSFYFFFCVWSSIYDAVLRTLLELSVVQFFAKYSWGIFCFSLRRGRFPRLHQENERCSSSSFFFRSLSLFSPPRELVLSLPVRVPTYFAASCVDCDAKVRWCCCLAHFLAISWLLPRGFTTGHTPEEQHKTTIFPRKATSLLSCTTLFCRWTQTNRCNR